MLYLSALWGFQLPNFCALKLENIRIPHMSVNMRKSMKLIENRCPKIPFLLPPGFLPHHQVPHSPVLWTEGWLRCSGPSSPEATRDPFTGARLVTNSQKPGTVRPWEKTIPNQQTNLGDETPKSGRYETWKCRLVMHRKITSSKFWGVQLFSNTLAWQGGLESAKSVLTPSITPINIH